MQRISEDDLRCAVCGGPKRLFLIHTPLIITFVLVGLSLAVVPHFVPWDIPYKRLFTIAGLLLMAGPLWAGIRIRCLRCEPQWRTKVS